MYGGSEKSIHDSGWGNLKERAHLEDLGMGGWGTHSLD
jgi:hypothetical protein